MSVAVDQDVGVESDLRIPECRDIAHLPPLLAAEAVTLRHDGDRARVEKACGTETCQITLDPPEGTP